jgi:2'-5' RNA ligase
LAKVPTQLQQLYDNIEDELTREGFPREKRKFSPHLTIGRLRKPENCPRIANLLITTGFDAETVSAGSVIVMRSDLKPAGSIYTSQCVIDLN